MRKLLAGASLALLISFVGPATPVLGKDPPPPDPTAVKADLDGNKLFDDLEARLASMAPDERLSVIVALDLPATLDRIQSLENTVGSFALSHRFAFVHGFTATLTKAQAQMLARVPLVVHVEENSVVQALNDSAQSSFGVTKARFDAAVDGDGDGNAVAYSKDDLVAAVIDTGIDAAHQDLDEGKVIGFANCIGGCRLAAPFDDHGHGTHVSATLAGQGDARPDRLYRGVAPAAGLVGVKVLDANGSGTSADVTAGIEWVIANKDVYGIEAINLSLGSSGCADGTDAESLAVNSAHAAGIVVAVAAGNSGPGTCTISSPAAAADAVTVGAMADLGVNGFKQAYFSSRGKTADGRIKPDVSAPGVSITSADSGTGTGYLVFSGTSMATPFVAGTALLMRDANSGLSSQQVKGLIIGTAIDWGVAGADIDYGAGRLDGYAAIEAAKGADIGASPAMPEHQFRQGTLPGTGATVDYQLNVTDTQFPIAATLIHPGIAGPAASTPDFDLYLFNPLGAQAARAETNRRQDELGFKPTTTGTYTLRVRSFSGSGAFFVDISAGTTPPPPDTTAPTVTAVSPADGATGVSASSNVSVTFSEAMNQPNTQGAFSLTGPAGAIAGSFSWSGSTMTFDPTASLAASTQYTARVTTAATDTAGISLAADKVWSFTVAAGPTQVTATPNGTAVITGSFRAGTAANLGSDDNAYYEVNSNNSSTRTSAWGGSFTGVSNSLANLKVSYTGKNSRSCSQTIAVWRWTTSTWIQLDSRTVGTTEVSVANLAPTGTLADYVSGTTGDGELRIRVRCLTSAGTFFSSGDLMKIAYERP